MNLDAYGLPVQSNGDNQDQLQRCGMINTAMAYGQPTPDPKYNVSGMTVNLEPVWGVFTRFTGGQTNDVSADQLIAALGASVASQSSGVVNYMFWRMCQRFGFAQNTVNGLGSEASQIPDFMFFRAMPMFCRANWYTYVFAYIFDWFLILMVLGDYYYKQTDPDPADCNDTVLTLAVCRITKPTLISWFACKMTQWIGLNFSGRLTRYHRAEAGGNPEIAAMWQPICAKYFE